MNRQSLDPAFSTRSIIFLLIAIACGLISLVRGYESIWLVAEWTGGISALAFIASLVSDARK
jgi:hypothetical protein